MTGEELLRISEELEAYYSLYDECFSRSEGREMIRRFARGQLGPLERKSLEPIADVEGIEPRALQLFFSRREWDEEEALKRHQQRVACELSRREGIFIIDETSDAKKGQWTAGVARQYCGESGKIDNCIVSVHTVYACDDRHCLLDGDLFLPESWNPDETDAVIMRKRERAQIPEEIMHRPKTELAMKQIERALANGVLGSYVTADELYGGVPWWREKLAALGLIYVVEVPNRIYGWIGEPQGPARSLKALAASHRRLRCGVKTKYITHETDKGPDVWECRRVWFTEQAEAAPKTKQTLLVARNVRTGEQKFFLSNAPRSMSTPACLKVAFSRWRVERCFEDCKGELGLNHAELRTYRGLHRHFILTAINYYFLQTRVREAGEKKSDGFATRRCPADPDRAAHRRSDDPPTATGAGRSVGTRYQAHSTAQSQSSYIGQTTTSARTLCIGDPG
jgi:SRSO17 transposase